MLIKRRYVNEIVTCQKQPNNKQVKIDKILEVSYLRTSMAIHCLSDADTGKGTEYTRKAQIWAEPFISSSFHTRLHG